MTQQPASGDVAAEATLTELLDKVAQLERLVRDLTGSQRDIRADQAGLLLESISLLGRGAAIAGSPPAPESAQWYIQSDFVTDTTSGGGHVDIVFPNPFPNGLLNVVMTNGNGDNIGGWPSKSSAGTTDRTQFVAYWMSHDGTAIASAVVDTAYIALGW